MPKMTFTRALKIAKRDYPHRSEKDQKRIASGIVKKSKSKKMRRLL